MSPQETIVLLELPSCESARASGRSLLEYRRAQLSRREQRGEQAAEDAEPRPSRPWTVAPANLHSWAGGRGNSVSNAVRLTVTNRT
ncbi:hypothetical protein CALVIDRAFT_374741 [Calocera viscosa TUFC12733]|uniref:Uncharacterized protein n=1 Tax=Calocera viscosa (strain TUFC12733) TaxID=1330018 RepID=A0A167GPK6_CALVF|nr:hypothetical protein CALVIDRAFT_374741 [Calocera viscosa TUFC12733]